MYKFKFGKPVRTIRS